MAEKGKGRATPAIMHVPAGATGFRCRFCEATVFFVITPRGRRMPVNCDVEGGRRPTATDHGSGATHFADCPGADAARSPRT